MSRFDLLIFDCDEEESAVSHVRSRF